jgi:hypothetical protein
MKKREIDFENLIFFPSDQSDYPQSFQPCEMPCSMEQYQQYDQQQPQQYQQQQQYQPQDESMYSSQIPTETQNPGYYDCNAGYNLAGQECTDYCDPCYQNEDTANTQDDLMCEQTDCRPCQDGCQLPMCSPYKKRRYIQPPRRQSFRPSACYKRPTIPMANETIYRKSFENVDPNTAACCRMPSYIPNGFLKTPQGPFEKETITKMSFQPFCGIERVKPIFPQSRSLLGKGPMQGLSTQKHDFVPKFQYKRSKIVPRDNISKSCGSIEKCTIQKLSFLPPCGISRTESFRPRVNYQRPNGEELN